MKSIYLMEATAEKLRPKPDREYINRLQQEERDLTLSVFKDTGRLMWLSTFNEKYPDQTIHEECEHVMVYMLGTNIQALKSGSWCLYLGDEMSVCESIEPLEEALFESIKDELEDCGFANDNILSK